MDINQILMNSGLSAGMIVIVGIIYKLCSHFRFRSSCCGNNSSMSIDLTPTKDSFMLDKKKEDTPV